MQDFCRGKIARYKIPKYVSFVDGYPMTASGKIQKYKLREQARRALGRRLTIPCAPGRQDTCLGFDGEAAWAASASKNFFCWGSPW